MTCQIDIKKKVPWKRRGVQMTDTDMNNLSLYLEKNYGLTSDRVIAKAIDIVANDNSFHPIIDLLESLKWDGRPRIAGMLTHFFGAENPEYSGEVMKMHMLAAISRLYDPGKKYDIMLCLVGGQGTGKSTFFKYLAIQDEWFTDDVKRLDDKKVYEYLQGHWIVEMSEMNAVANAKSIEYSITILIVNAGSCPGFLDCSHMSICPCESYFFYVMHTRMLILVTIFNQLLDLIRRKMKLIKEIRNRIDICSSQRSSDILFCDKQKLLEFLTVTESLDRSRGCSA